MRVKELMSVKVFTVTPDDMVDRVFFLFNFESIRHLPVVENDKVVGVVSDRDLKKVLGPWRPKKPGKNDLSSFTLPSRKVKTLMRRGLTTIGPEEKAADAAAIMAKKKIGCLPVVSAEKLVGIITATDILRAFVRLSEEVDKLHKETAKTS
ncbi:MAG: CBS domain-containing protein [Nitrospinae bacterium]|nr:CBS domain-containing protein [Nitrospinota bacterium]